MKPSKFVTVKGKKAWLMLPGFSCFTWKGYAYCKSQKEVDKINATDKIDSQMESHETIHIRQAESMKDSWFRFYTRYVWEWICNFPLIFVNFYAPYKFMEIEMEAYLNQDDWDYCMQGARYQWLELEKCLTLKEKRAMAKEYYKNKTYYTAFLREKLKEYGCIE